MNNAGKRGEQSPRTGLTRISACTGCDQPIGDEQAVWVKWPMAQVLFHARCLDAKRHDGQPLYDPARGDYIVCDA